MCPLYGAFVSDLIAASLNSIIFYWKYCRRLWKPAQLKLEWDEKRRQQRPGHTSWKRDSDTTDEADDWLAEASINSSSPAKGLFAKSSAKSCMAFSSVLSSFIESCRVFSSLLFSDNESTRFLSLNSFRDLLWLVDSSDFVLRNGNSKIV